MNRRRFLRTLVAPGALALAGCASDDPAAEPSTEPPTDGPAGSPTESETPVTESETATGTSTATPTDTPTETPTETADAEISLSVASSQCGTEVDDAAITFDSDAGTAAVSGTIWGRSSCYVARLQRTAFEESAFVVTVAAEEDADEGVACAQCIAEIDYEATATFADGLPEKVVVRHARGDRTVKVTSASP